MQGISKAISILKKEYPDSKYYLKFSNPLQLMVAAIMSAQVRDSVVNATTPYLFKKYRTANDYANSNVTDIETAIKSVTFYKNKAKNIKEACKILVEKHNGDVPKTMDELTELPGIGRKTANAIMINAFNIVEGIPVDTHVIRLSQRLGWTKNKDPEKIEQDLMKTIPRTDWKTLPHLLKDNGRSVCTSVPGCDKCVLNKLCPKIGVK
ncbi:MAG: endonuclease III [Ignavibacteriae bacterium]|nr:endonuclease III [Ignavibacteriota bacterium]